MKNKAINTKHRNGLASSTSSNPISSSDSNAPRRRGNSKEQPVLNKKDNNNKNAKVIKRQTLIVSMGEEDNGWYDIARQTPGRNDTIATVSKTGGAPVVTGANNIVSNWRQRADELWVNEMSLFMEIYKSNQTSDDRWIEATMTKGTMKDKIAAMSILIANHPFHQLKILDNLLNLCSSTGNGNSRISQMAGEALTDLFINTLLPPNRNLIPLNQRPFHLYEQQNSVKTNNYKTLSPRVLLLWRYEELLKQKYMTFLNNCIASWLNDALDQHKNFALKIAITLLSDRSEGEAILLGLIVNKIGDPSRKVAAAAGHQLRRLLETHPVMTPIVAREVQQLAFRPHVSPRTLYNCIVFLNQLRLTDIDKELPVSLVRTYFKLFEVAVASSKDGEHQSTTKRTSKEKNQKKTSSSSTGGTNSNMTTEIKSRLLGALLTGVNRARPFLPKSDQKMEEYVDALYRISHKAPSASASTQALMLLFHLAIGTAEATSVTPADTNHINNKSQDRFYRLLYSKLSDPSMYLGTKHVTMFFNLIYKSMKYDTKDIRIVAFAKRLLQTATISGSAAIIAGALFLISEVMKSKNGLKISVEQNIPTVYNSAARDPSFALLKEGQESGGASLWEISMLLFHFHPSVVKFSETIGHISYNSDPLRNFTLAPFLDRFAYKQPKAAEKSTSRGRDRFIQGKSSIATTSVPLNDSSLLGVSNVAVENKFFHRYFEERARRDEKKGIVRNAKKKSEEDDDDEDDDIEAIHANEANLDAYVSVRIRFLLR